MGNPYRTTTRRGYPFPAVSSATAKGNCGSRIADRDWITANAVSRAPRRWRDTLRLMPGPRLEGPLSDTRVAARLADLCGTGALGRLPGRWVFFERGFTETYGGWRRWRGMTASNLCFVRTPFRADPEEDADAEDWWTRPLLPLPPPCGHPDTPEARAWPHNANHAPKTAPTASHPIP